MKISILFVSLSIVGCSYLLAGGESGGASAGEPLITITVSNVPLRDALSKLAERTLPLGVVVNFEQLRSDLASNSHVTANLKAVSITNALVKLLQNDCQYSWEKNGQVVNVFAVEDKRNPKNVLNQIIPELRIQDKDRYEIVSTVLEACNRITSGKYKIIKDGNAIDQLQAYRIPCKEFGIPEPVLRKHNFTFRDLSVREILNAISREENIRWEILAIEANREMSILVFSLGVQSQDQ